MARCTKHGGQCSREIKANHESAPEGATVLTALTGGSPCIDYTTMGNQQMSAGSTAIHLLILLRMVLEWKPDLFIHENVIQFPMAMIMECLKEIYTFDSVVLTPESLGFPIHRRRQYLLGRLTSKWKILNCST